MGDAVAWNSFVRATAGIIHAAVRKANERNGGSPNDTDDHVQEVYLRLLRENQRLLRTFDASRASLATWLTIIARTVVHERSRRAASRPVPLTLNDGDGSHHATTTGASTLRDEGPDLPWRALSPQQQEVLRLLFHESLSVEQAAARLGVDQQTIRSAKHKALQRLRDELSLLRGDETAATRLSHTVRRPESDPDVTGSTSITH